MSEVRRLSNEEVRAVGTVRQVFYTKRADQQSTTSKIPITSLPVSTDGAEAFSFTFTPKKVGNRLLIEGSIMISEETNAVNHLVAALFVDDIFVTGATQQKGASTATDGGRAELSYEMTATGSIDIKVRFGSAVGTAVTATLNNYTVSNTEITFGTIGTYIYSWVKITEIEA